MQRGRMVDFRDLITGAIELLQSTPRLREHMSANFRLILVDEFQDVDPAQIRAAPADAGAACDTATPRGRRRSRPVHLMAFAGTVAALAQRRLREGLRRRDAQARRLLPLLARSARFRRTDPHRNAARNVRGVPCTRATPSRTPAVVSRVRGTRSTRLSSARVRSSDAMRSRRIFG